MHFLVACDNGIGSQLAYFLELQVVRSVVSGSSFYWLLPDKENTAIILILLLGSCIFPSVGLYWPCLEIHGNYDQCRMSQL